MTLSVSTQVSPIGSKLIIQTSATSAADNDVTGASGILYMVDVDNGSNGSNPAYLKVYDNASPTVGTTAPDLIFKVAASLRRSFVIPEGIAFTNLSMACVIEAGTAGTTDPTSDVPVRLVTT